VLDVGCGSTALCTLAASRSRFVVGVDVSVDPRSVASSRVSLVCASADALPFRPGVFDTVVCTSTLHHVCLADGLREVARAVGPKGSLLVRDFIRAQSVLPSKMVSEVGRALRDCLRHVRPYGWISSVRILRFRLSPSWLRHVRADKFQTMAAWRSVVSSYAPGAVTSTKRNTITVTWCRSTSRIGVSS
jgi:ubiquinone/menaquinone biosynthesis C-methylase UbiE